MTNSELTETLQALVNRHGLKSVLHSLADAQVQPTQQSPSSTSSRRQSDNSENKRSAVDYVDKMKLPPEKAEVMMRVAQRFEDRRFLPSVADIREFCRVYDVKLGKSVSRATSIPRVFTFLAVMDSAEVTKLIERGAFSGPTLLSPIADAIRNRSAVRVSERGTGSAFVESGKTPKGSSEKL